VSKKWVIIRVMDKLQHKSAASIQAEKSGLSAKDRYCARGSGGAKTAWKQRRMKTSLVVVMLLFRVMTYVVFYKLFFRDDRLNRICMR